MAARRERDTRYGPALPPPTKLILQLESLVSCDSSGSSSPRTSRSAEPTSAQQLQPQQSVASTRTPPRDPPATQLAHASPLVAAGSSPLQESSPLAPSSRPRRRAAEISEVLTSLNLLEEETPTDSPKHPSSAPVDVSYEQPRKRPRLSPESAPPTTPTIATTAAAEQQPTASTPESASRTEPTKSRRSSSSSSSVLTPAMASARARVTFAARLLVDHQALVSSLVLYGASKALATPEGLLMTETIAQAEDVLRRIGAIIDQQPGCRFESEFAPPSQFDIDAVSRMPSSSSSSIYSRLSAELKQLSDRFYELVPHQRCVPIVSHQILSDKIALMYMLRGLHLYGGSSGGSSSSSSSSSANGSHPSSSQTARILQSIGVRLLPLTRDSMCWRVIEQCYRNSNRSTTLRVHDILVVVPRHSSRTATTPVATAAAADTRAPSATSPSPLGTAPVDNRQLLWFGAPLPALPYLLSCHLCPPLSMLGPLGKGGARVRLAHLVLL